MPSLLRLPHHCRLQAAITLAALLALPAAPTTTAGTNARQSASRPSDTLALSPSALPAARPAVELPYAEAGPHQAGWRRVQVAPGAGPAFAALVHYPALAAGEGAALDRAGAPYPAIAFGHGFFQEPLRYAGLLEHLAGWGLVVISTESQAGLAPDHALFAADLSASLSACPLSGASSLRQHPLPHPRLVPKVGPQPPLRLPHRPALARRVIRHLVRPDPPQAEIARRRMVQVQTAD